MSVVIVTLPLSAVLLPANATATDPCSTVGTATCTVTSPTVLLSSCGCGSEGGTHTDTECWQAAIAAATNSTAHTFGSIQATQNVHYQICSTLVVDSVLNGIIDGNGSTLEWVGGYTALNSDHANRASLGSLFLLRDTQSLILKNMFLVASSTHHLWTGIELTNGTSSYIAPKANIIDHVNMEGSTTSGLDYGIAFTTRYGSDGDGVYDQDNDQATISNLTIYNVMKAAISIEGYNSHQHRLYAVNGTGAPNNQAYDNDDISPTTTNHLTGASFVRLKHGGFDSVGGFHGFFANAEYYIEDAQSEVTIVDSDSEGCFHFLKSQDGYAAYQVPVHVVGGRFAIATETHGGYTYGLASDGRIIDWQRYGPLTIEGIEIDGSKPSGVSGDPNFYIQPRSPYSGDHQPVPYEVSYLSVRGVGSSSWSLFQTNSDTRLITHGNMCISSDGTNSVPCTGTAAGTNDAIETLTSKTFDTAGSGNVLKVNGTQISAVTGSGSAVLATSPALVTPSLGVASASTVNKVAITAPATSATLTIADGKTATVSNTLTLAGTDSTTITFQGTDTYVGRGTTDVLTNKDLTSGTNTFPKTSTVIFTTSSSVSSSRYCALNNAIGCNTTTESAVSIGVAPFTVKGLRCKASAASGNSGKTWTFNIMKNGSANSTSCSIGGSATTCADASTSVDFSDGDTISLQIVATSITSAVTVFCSLGVSPPVPAL